MIKYKDIYKLITVINKLYYDNNITAVLKFATLKNIQALRKEEEILNQLGKAMFDKYVEKDDNGSYKRAITNVQGRSAEIPIFTDKKMYDEELNQIQENTFKLPEKFNLDDLLNSSLSANEIEKLQELKMIKEDVKTCQKKQQ